MSTNDDTAHHLSLAIAFTFRSRRKFGSTRTGNVGVDVGHSLFYDL